MKIVFVVFSLRGGGAERVVSQLANSLVDDLPVAVVQLSEIPPFYELHEKVEHITYSGPQYGALRYAKLAHYLFFALRGLAPDIVISFGETINPFVIAVSRMAGFPIIVSNRASPISSLTGRRGWLNPLAYRLARSVIVQTDRAVELLEKRYRGCRWIVMNNPVRVPEDVPHDSERENLCVSVGFLGGQKNQAAILRSFAQSAPADWSLVLVGHGPDRGALERLSLKLGLVSRVQFTGAISNVDEFLARARIFAFASRSEGTPNALAEGMANGCACIAYDCVTGPRELIDHGESGLLIALDDEHEFSEGLGRLMSDADLRAKLSSGAREKAKSFVLERVRREFIASISQVLNNGS